MYRVHLYIPWLTKKGQNERHLEKMSHVHGNKVSRDEKMDIYKYIEDIYIYIFFVLIAFYCIFAIFLYIRGTFPSPIPHAQKEVRDHAKFENAQQKTFVLLAHLCHANSFIAHANCFYITSAL